MSGLLPDRQFYEDIAKSLGGGIVDPDFWTGAGKELTIGLAGLPGDLGFAVGNAPAVYRNWNEGNPLMQDVGDPNDYGLTSDSIARSLGMEFTGSGPENAGRALAGAIDIGALLGLLKRIGQAFPDVPYAGPKRNLKQGGGPWIEGKVNNNILKYYPERGGEPVDIIRNPTPEQLTDLKANINDSAEEFGRMPEIRWIEDPKTGDIYGGDANVILHEDLAKAAGIETWSDQNSYKHGLSDFEEMEWYGKNEVPKPLGDEVLGRRQAWPEKPDSVKIDMVDEDEWRASIPKQAEDEWFTSSPTKPGLTQKGRGERGAVGLLDGATGDGQGLLKLPRGRGKDLKAAKTKARQAEKDLDAWRAMTPEQQAENAAERGVKLSRASFAVEDAAKQARKDVIAIENLRTVEPTVPDARRAAYPGVYKNPSRLAAEAEARVGPEDPALKEIFGVTRDDLFEMQKGRVGGKSELIKRPKTGRIPKSEALDAVMSPRNTERLVENLDVAKREAPELIRGMAPWYVMDPMYQRQVELLGPEEATRLFNQMQTLTGMSSPGSGVMPELHRGLAASYLQEQGRFDEFVNRVGKSIPKRGKDFPADIAQVPGHMAHSTAHVKPMIKFLDTGKVDMDSVKVPSYIEAAGVPDTPGVPFQTKTPVGDAHFVRGLGLSDVRTGGDYGKSITSPELRGLEDWWYDEIAQPSGFESVPGQAINWGLYAPQTGVETDIGAGKLELLARHIKDQAAKRGIDPTTYRDMVLSGKAFGFGGAGLLGAGLYQDQPAAVPGS